MFAVISCGVCAVPIASSTGFDNCKPCDGKEYDCKCDHNDFQSFSDFTECSGCKHIRHEKNECTEIGNFV